MLLHGGITGFYRIEGNERKTAVELTEFKKLCHAAAKNLGGKVVLVSDPSEYDWYQNFYQAELKLNGESIYILQNGPYPFFAFASEVEYMDIKFRDHQVLCNELEAYNPVYRVLRKSELSERIRPHGRKQQITNENTLGQGELNNIFYWDSKTVGEVIFNYWD